MRRWSYSVEGEHLPVLNYSVGTTISFLFYSLYAGNSPRSAQGPLQQRTQFLQKLWFVDHGAGAASRTGGLKLRARIHRHQNDLCLRLKLREQERCPQTAHSRHISVHQHQVWFKFEHGINGFGTALNPAQHFHQLVMLQQGTDGMEDCV